MTTENNSSEVPSSALSELLKTGRLSFDPAQVKYVCHTSTIPLATTIDEQHILKSFKNSVEVTHSILYQPGYDIRQDYRCCKKHCMYVSPRKSESEILRANCPCGMISRTELIDGIEEEVEVFLQPLCFIQVLKETRYSFGYTDASECDSGPECCHNDKPGNSRSNRPKISLKQVMFCQNSQSITDGAYSRPLRNVTKFSGWESIKTPEQLALAMDQLYWHRKYIPESFRRFLDDNIGEFRRFKQMTIQSLHTLNGLLTQKFLLFPCEMENYTAIAKHTADLYQSLMRDYLKVSVEVPTPENSIFMFMKEVKGLVKQRFCSENREMRFSVFPLILESKQRNAFTRFWGTPFRRLYNRIIGMNDDYSNSPAWMYTMGGFAQTRNLGYLPTWVAEHSRKQFRETIGREKVLIPVERLKFLFKIVQRQMLDAHIEPKFLTRENRKSNRDFREVINSLKIPLKRSASNVSTVANGGKVEDARLLLNDAMSYKWKTPIRDFETGQIKSWLVYGAFLKEEKPNYEEYLFWAALQILLNDFSKRYEKFKAFHHKLPNSEFWEENLWTMQIVHISEPGKERNLTKTSSIVSWVLTVCSKISQTILAYHQDHRAGLVLSAQDWMHQRRVSGESYESYWMYDKRTRRRITNVWNGFQDWTESTDFIPRQIGTIALQAFFTYVDMPKWFGNLCTRITLQDYHVNELIRTDWDHGVPEKTYFSGKVTEGFMMSMPLTKTILHLMHDINVGVVNAIFRHMGVELSKRSLEPRSDLERDRLGPYSIPQEFL